MQVDYRPAAIGDAVATLIVGYLTWDLGNQRRSEVSPVPSPPLSYGVTPLALLVTVSRDGQAVTLSQSQLQYIKVALVELHDFANRRGAVGNIDLNQDRVVQVFTSYQGKIRNTYAKMGDTVTKGKPLSDIDSPDLVQAESTLIPTAGTRKPTTAALTRARQLFKIQDLAQKDLDQAISGQQAAGAAYKVARKILTMFGKTPVQVDQIMETRKTDSLLAVVSLISDQVTACSVQLGLLLQPGDGTTPFTVADVSIIWIQAFVPETGAPLLHVGQPVKIHVVAFPDRALDGKITTVGVSVDVNMYRTLMRLEIDNPKHELRPGISTSFDIATGTPIQSPVLTMDSVVREGDGTMTTWATTDCKRFMRRVIKLGLGQDGFVQVLEGLSVGELAANKGALYLGTAAAGNLNGAD